MNSSYIVLSVFGISLVFVFLSAVLLMKRTGIPNIHDSYDLTYIILTAGALSGIRLTEKNIIASAVLSSFILVAVNAGIVQLGISNMVRYLVCGFLILLFATAGAKNK